MVLHLGDDCFVPIADVLIITPYGKITPGSDTAEFLNGLETMRVAGVSKPKSAVVVQEDGVFKAYLSPISSATLFKRGMHKMRNEE